MLQTKDKCFFLSSYNQNLKIDIFTPLKQILCYCKSRLDTLRLISWWRVTNDCCKQRNFVHFSEKKGGGGERGK